MSPTRRIPVLAIITALAASLVAVVAPRPVYGQGTETPTRTVTVTRTPSATRTATRIPSPTNTRTPTLTRTATLTRTPTPTRTLTPVPTSTRTKTPTPTRTPTITPTPTATPMWPTVRLVGGPAYGVSVGAPERPTEGLQRVYAASVDVLVSERGDSWQHTTGTGPAVNVVAGPAGVIYAANSDGKGFRSRNAGRGWGRVIVRGDDPFRIVAVSPDYGFDRTAYAVTVGDWRLYTTNNDGSAWTETKLTVDVDDQIGAVAFSPWYDLDETVFVAAARGLFKWRAQSQSWALVAGPASGLPAFGPAGGPLASQGLLLPYEYGDDPTRLADPDLRTIFAYNASGIWRSDDDGVSWTRLALPSSIEQIAGLAVSNRWPADPVLAVAVRAPGAVGAVSWDNGASWTMVAGRDGIQGTGVAMSRDFAPIPPPDFAVVSRIYLPFASDDSPGKRYIGSRELFIATDGDGVYRSRDAGRTWEPSASTFTSVVVTSLAALGGMNDPVLAGSETAGLYRSDDGGRTWTWADVGLPRGAYQIVHSVRVSPGFATDRTVFLAASSGLWFSRDAGRTWSRTAGPLDARAIAISPDFARDRTIVAGGQMSTDAGATWSPLPTVATMPDQTTTQIRGNWTAIAFSPDYATDRTLWVGTDLIDADQRYAIFRSTDNGQTWTGFKANPFDRAVVHSILPLRVDPGEPMRIFVGTSRGIAESFDGGTDWRSGGLTARPTWDIAGRVVREPSLLGIIVAATEDGAVWSTNRGLDWVREPASPKDLRAATITGDARLFLIGNLVGVSRFETGLGGD
jgi:photosystem II stability/assembly factor-like uncharacterized protein